jgi:hypothetical protein
MSNPDFAKCGCGHCGGHIEFPAAASGQTVACPHCGRPTVLAAAIPSKRRPAANRLALAVLLIGILLAAGAVVFRVSPKRTSSPVASLSLSAPRAPAAPLAGSNPPPVLPPAPVVAPSPQPQAVTNGFDIMPYKLENAAGSSLVYVVGTVRNTSDRQRFGVKVEFSLLDTNNRPVGSATDYEPVLDPRAEWRFKAMVMASKTASARFHLIAEDQ